MNGCGVIGTDRPDAAPPRGQALRWGVLAVLGTFVIGPVLLGLGLTLAVAAGWGPGNAGGASGALIARPGILTSLRLTAFTGLASTLAALAAAAGLVALIQPRAGSARLGRAVAAVAAAPHAAVAIGLAFLLAPSGWAMRLAAPLAGWTEPPAVATVNDPWGLALTLGLAVKETPFLVLAMLSGLSQIPVARLMVEGRALGYGRAAVWLALVAPRLWPLLRLPVWAVLAYGLSVVDMAIVLGPSNPPTLAVAVTRWMTGPDPALIGPAMAGALALALLAGAALTLFWLAERLVAALGRRIAESGHRGRVAAPAVAAAGVTGAAVLLLGLLSLAVLAPWSAAWRWPWPLVLPESWSLALWSAPAQGWGRATANTALSALGGTAAALALAIAWLEAGDRTGRDRAAGGLTGLALVLIYVPLIVPQVAFLFGLHIGFLRAGLAGGMAAVTWATALFAFPYVLLALSDPWRALDRRLIAAAASLGAGPDRILFTVKLPILLRPVLTAAAVGIAVGCGQYLPVLVFGEGRVPTLTTEAVALSSGADRRIVAVHAVLQTALPWIAYALATSLPALIHRDRRGLEGAAR